MKTNSSWAKKPALILMLSLSLKATASLLGGHSVNPVDLSPMIVRLDETLALLKSWSSRNIEQTKDLQSRLEEQAKLNNKNQQKPNLEQWEKIYSLNQNTLLMLEASYDFAGQYGQTAGYINSAKRSEAWVECLQNNDCSFAGILDRLDEEALKISDFAKTSADKAQDNIRQAITSLEEFTNEAHNASGFSDSLDILTKINAAAAESLFTLSSQMSDLLRLTASKELLNGNKELLENQVSKRFMAGDSKQHSPHLSVMLSDHVH